METTIVNGIEEVSSAVVAVRMNLEAVLEGNPIVFYEAVMIARDRSHVPFGNAGEKLKEWGLLQSADGQMHSTVRNVILASVEGDGLEMCIGPLKQAAGRRAPGE